MNQWLWTYDKLEKTLLRRKETNTQAWATWMLHRLYPEQSERVLQAFIPQHPGVAFTPYYDLNAAVERYTSLAWAKDKYLHDSSVWEMYYFDILVKKDPGGALGLLKKKYPDGGSGGKDRDTYLESLKKLAAHKVPGVAEAAAELWLPLETDPDMLGIEDLIHIRLLLGEDFESLALATLNAPDPSGFIQLLAIYGQTRLNLDAGLDETEELSHYIRSLQSDNPEEREELETEFVVNFKELLENLDQWLLESLPGGRSMSDDIWAGNYDGVMSAVSAAIGHVEKTAAEQYGEEALLQWTVLPGRPAENIRMMKCLLKLYPELHEDLHEAAVIAAVLALEEVAENASVVGAMPESFHHDPKQVMAFFFQHRDDSPTDEALAVWLAEQKGETGAAILDACFSELDSDCQCELRSRIVRLLLRIPDAAVFLRLMRAGIPPHLESSVAAAGISRGFAVTEMLEPLLSDQTVSSESIRRIMAILWEFPVEKTVTLMLRYWERFWSSHRLTANRFLDILPDRRFLIPLKKEMAEGELLEKQTYIKICAVNGVKDPLIATFEKELKNLLRAITKRFSLLQEGKLREYLETPIPLKLRCRLCGRDYVYNTGLLVLDGYTGESFLPEPMECKHCGAAGDYEFLAENETTISETAQLCASFMEMENEKSSCGDPHCGERNAHAHDAHEHDSGNPDHPPAPDSADRFSLVFASMIYLDGAHCHSSDAINFYREKLALEPQNAAYLANLAYALHRSGQFSASVPYYMEAEKQDPRMLDPYIALSEYYRLKKDYQRAFEYYQKLEQLNFNGPLTAMTHEYEDAEDVKFSLIPFYLEIALRLKKEVSPSTWEWYKKHSVSG